MKYTAIILLSVATSSLLNAQQDLHQIIPRWKLGDERKVHTVMISKMTVGDTVIADINAVSDYLIKVTDTAGHYTLLYSQTSEQLDLEMNSPDPAMDSATQFVMRLAKRVEKDIAKFEYRVLVDKQTGLAFDIVNKPELLNAISVSLKNILAEIGSAIGIPEAEIEIAQEQMLSYFKSVQPQIVQTVLNTVNMILQAYSFTFPINSTVSQQVMTQPVNVLGDFGSTEFPAVLSVTSRETANSTLTVNTDLAYNKKFLLEQIKKNSPGLSNVNPEDIIITEKDEIVFDMKTFWIIKHISDVVFELQKVKSASKTVITFK